MAFPVLPARTEKDKGVILESIISQSNHALTIEYNRIFETILLHSHIVNQYTFGSSSKSTLAIINATLRETDKGEIYANILTKKETFKLYRGNIFILQEV